MHCLLRPGQPFLRTFIAHWLGTVRDAVPLFMKLLPAYIALTVLAATVSVAILLVLGKGAFHLACMFSPLIFIIIGMAIRSADSELASAGRAGAWLPVVTRFWRYATPLAVTIGLTLNIVILVSLFLADITAVHAGRLPNLSFPSDLFSAEKLPLLPMLLTTAVEQQFLFMPLFVVLGGRFEPHLVGMLLGGRLSISEARAIQGGFTKRQKLFLGPMRILVLVGVCFQYWGKEIDATQNGLGTVMLLISYFGWLFYACLLAVLVRGSTFEFAKKNPA